MHIYVDYRPTTYAYIPVSSYVCKGILGLPNNTGRKNSKQQFHYSFVAKTWRTKYFKSSLPKVKT